MITFTQRQFYEAAQDFSASQFRAVGKLQQRPFDSGVLQQKRQTILFLYCVEQILQSFQVGFDYASPSK